MAKKKKAKVAKAIKAKIVEKAKEHAAKKAARKKDRVFPTFAAILLVIGIVWLLNELKIISIQIPWVPVVLIVIAIGMIVNKYCRCCG